MGPAKADERSYYLSLTYRTSCSLILGDSDDRVPDIVPHPAFTTTSLKRLDRQACGQCPSEKRLAMPALKDLNRRWRARPS